MAYIGTLNITAHSTLSITLWLTIALWALRPGLHWHSEHYTAQQHSQHYTLAYNSTLSVTPWLTLALWALHRTAHNNTLNITSWLTIALWTLRHGLHWHSEHYTTQRTTTLWALHSVWHKIAQNCCTPHSHLDCKPKCIDQNILCSHAWQCSLTYELCKISM